MCVFLTRTLTRADPINHCFQRLTYEEKMARRLLGADNAATVLNTQDTEEEPVTQVRQLFIRIHTHWREEQNSTRTNLKSHRHETVLPAYLHRHKSPCCMHTTHAPLCVSTDTSLVSFLSHDHWLSSTPSHCKHCWVHVMKAGCKHCKVLQSPP